MSKQTVERLVGKIVLDASFREALLAAPDPTLAGFELLESEKTWLKHIDHETMEALAYTLSLCPGKLSPASRVSYSKPVPNGGKKDE